MQSLSSFRTSLGISQRQLAAFIGGDRTQLVRAEKGERNLSADAAINFSALLPAWQAALQVPVPDAGSSSAEQRQEWQWQAIQCRKKAKALQQQLAGMQALYESAFRLQHFVLQVSQSQLSLTDRQQRWLEQRQYEVQHVLEENKASRQITISLQIAALEAEAGVYENALPGTGTT